MIRLLKNIKLLYIVVMKYGRKDYWKYVQFYCDWRSTWVDCCDPAVFNVFIGCEYRLKKPTHFVNGIECPAPMVTKPKLGDFYFTPTLGIVHRLAWYDDTLDNCLFRDGDVFETYEDALENLNARKKALDTNGGTD